MPSTVSDIEAVRSALEAATTYTAVFGPMPADAAGRRARLRTEYLRLARIVHPDVAPRDAQDLAADAFKLLAGLHEAAEAALADGRYDVPFARGATTSAARPTKDGSSILQSANGIYKLEPTPFRSGDFSVLYRAQSLNDSLAPVFVKLSSEPANNQYLEREQRIIARATARSGLTPYLPDIVDSFLVNGDGGTRFRATVMKPQGDRMSLTELRERMKRPLGASEAGWIMRRVMAQVLAAGMLGVVHGAIVPDHVLVDPGTREPCHIGWAHAADVEHRERITTIIDRWRDWYPPEVVDRNVPDERTDLYMAAKTILWMVGGDPATNRFPSWVPESITRCLAPCLAPRRADRPRDGRALLDELTRVVRAAWGRTYAPLDVPR